MFDDFKHYLKQLKVFALGKGILSLAVLGAAAVGAAFGISVLLPAVVVGVGGTILTAVNRLYTESLLQQEMVDVYREGIAQQLHIAPEQVTRAHLKEAAKENRIIAHELEQQHKKTLLTISTAALAGLVSVALIGVFNFGDMLHGLAQANFSGVLEPLVSLIGASTVSAATGLVLHDGLDAAIGYHAGLHKTDPNDLIVKLHRTIERGQPISREQVYSIVVADDVTLQQKIKQQFHKHYASMSPAQQSQVLHRFGVAKEMDDLALALTNKEMKPGQIAFLTADYHPKNMLSEAVAETAPEAKGATFVERLGLAARTSHAQQLEQRRLLDTQPIGRA